MKCWIVYFSDAVASGYYWFTWGQGMHLRFHPFMSYPLKHIQKISFICGDVLRFRCYVLTGGKVIVWSVVGWTRSSAYPLEFLCYEVGVIIIVYSFIILLWTPVQISTPTQPTFRILCCLPSLCILCYRCVTVSSFLCVVLNFSVTVCFFEWLDVVVPLQAWEYFFS